MSNYTDTDLAAIRRCIASGTLEFRFADGRSQRFQSLDELMRAEQRIAAAVAAAAPTARARRRTVAYRSGC